MEEYKYRVINNYYYDYSFWNDNNYECMRVMDKEE